MPNASNTKFSVTDLSYSPAIGTKGIHCVAGITKRGPVASPDILITSWPQFARIYGGLLANSDFPLLCQRALLRGSSLRVSRVVNYTDPADHTSMTALKAEISTCSLLTVSDDFITGNQIDLSVEGADITTVNFDTDHNTTLASLAGAIGALNTVAHASVVPDPADETLFHGILILLKNTTANPTISGAITGGVSQASLSVAQKVGLVNTHGEILLTVTPKYPGADYNKLYVRVLPGSNGQSGYYNVVVGMTGEDITETYSNLFPGSTQETLEAILGDLNKSSQLVEFSAADTSSYNGGNNFLAGYTYWINGGSDGADVVDADYIGDPAGKTGLYAFDEVDDSLDICFPEITSTAVHAAGSAYVDNRGDMQYFAHLSNANTTSAAYVADRAATNIDSYLTRFFGGGIWVTDPRTGQRKSISELGDQLGIISQTDAEFGEWYSSSGLKRGVFKNVLGVVNNFGSPGKYGERNEMSQRQINCVVLADNVVHMTGNFTAALGNSKLSWANEVRCMLFIQRILRPVIKRYIEDPNDPTSWRALFNEVEPFFQSLVRDRALSRWDWQGDQDVTNPADVKINTPQDLDNGKYKVKLFVTFVGTMNEIEININVTPTATTFELP